MVQEDVPKEIPLKIFTSGAIVHFSERKKPSVMKNRAFIYTQFLVLSLHPKMYTDGCPALWMPRAEVCPTS